MSSFTVDIVRAEYQRNGIGGEGFYAAVIHCDGETLLATITNAYDSENWDACSCRVVNPFDLSDHYRGDRIGDELIPKLEAYIKAQREPQEFPIPDLTVDPEPESADEEKNITKQFGCYSAELNIERDGGDLVSWCHVSTTRRGVEYCSSLGVVENYGTIEAESGDVVNVPDAVVGRIQRWADKNGY